MSAQPKPKKPPKEYDIPPGTRPAKCRSCQATIYWVKVGVATHPLDLVTHETIGGTKGTSHFLTCPNASDWSGSKRPAGTGLVGVDGQSGALSVDLQVKGCARCGLTHIAVRFLRLSRPAKSFQWWGLCPKTGEPILMRSTIVGKEGAE